MKDTPVFDDVPEFSPDGTNVKPGTAKYSGGWVSGEILPFDYANWLFNGLTKNGVVGSESLASVHAELKALLTLFGLTPSDLSDSQIANYFASHGLQYGYDIVIDSDAKLDEWAQCTDGSLKRVLIKAGTWTASALGPTAGVLINLDATGTNYVFAEPGALIQYSEAISSITGLYHATLPVDVTLERFIGVKIALSNTTGGAVGFYRCANMTDCGGICSGVSTAYGFRECNNLMNCYGTCSGGGMILYGFIECTKLTNCTGTSTDGSNESGGFQACSDLMNCVGVGAATGNGNSNGFRSCNDLTNCRGTGTGAGSGDGRGFFDCEGVILCRGVGIGTPGYGFIACNKMQQNKALAASTTATYNTSYADAGSANACADTAAGGYNS